MNHKIVSSATGRIDKLFFIFHGSPFLTDIIEKMIKTLHHSSEVVILVKDEYGETEATRYLSHLEKQYLHKFDIKLAKDLNIARKWIRDPFHFIEGPNREMLMVESLIQHKRNVNVAEVIQQEVYPDAEVKTNACFVIDGGNILADKNFILIGANQYTHLLYCLKNITKESPYTNKKLIQEANKTIKAKFNLSKTDEIHYIGEIDWDFINKVDELPLIKRIEAFHNPKKEDLFSPDLWFNKHAFRLDDHDKANYIAKLKTIFPKTDEKEIEKIDVIRLRNAISQLRPYIHSPLTPDDDIHLNKSLNTILPELLHFDEQPLPLEPPSIEDEQIIPQNLVTKLAEVIHESIPDPLPDIDKEALLELFKIVGDPIPHIDLFISLTGITVKSGNKNRYLIFVAEPCLLYPEEDVLPEINAHKNMLDRQLNKVVKDLHRKGFYVDRIPLPLIHEKDSSKWILGYYCNNLVENTGESTTIWYPKLSTSRLLNDVWEEARTGLYPGIHAKRQEYAAHEDIMRRLAEIEEEIIHILYQYSIKAIGVQSRDYGVAVCAMGALHCMTKETRITQ